MNFSAPFIRRPIGTTLLAIGLFLVGAVAYVFLPVASLPTFDLPTISVVANRPGADPATMASTVAAPLERRLGEIAGVTEITSVSTLNSTGITVQFDLARNIDGAARDVQAALNAATADLPPDLPQVPTFRKANPSAAPILILALTSDTIEPGAIFDIADTVIAPRLSQVDGVAQVSIVGAEQPAVRAQVDPTALASMGIGLEDVRNAIVNSNAAGPNGVFDGPARAETIGTNDQLKTASDYGPIVVRTAKGTIVRLADIAQVHSGVRNTLSAAWFNRQPAVVLIISKQVSANVIDTVDRIYGARRSQGLDAERSHGDHPDQRPRHADDPGCHRRTGDAGGVPVPAPRNADDRGRRHRAAVAGRHLRRDVGGGLFDRQSVADGAGGLGGLCGRRCHCHDRKRVSQHRGRQIAAAGNDRRREADRLHRSGDQPVPDRCLHSATVHGRHRRPGVP